LVEEGRVRRSVWPAVQEALRQATREALARPGAEGLAARDELLDAVRRFADLHLGLVGGGSACSGRALAMLWWGR
jgi:hypothetical protein